MPDPDFPFLGVHLTRERPRRGRRGPERRVGARARRLHLGVTSTSDTSPRLSPSPARCVSSVSTGGKVSTKCVGPSISTVSCAICSGSCRRCSKDDSGSRPTPACARRRWGATERLLDDFHFVDGPHAVHVLNAPSPAATASLAIGEAVADRVQESGILEGAFDRPSETVGLRSTPNGPPDGFRAGRVVSDVSLSVARAAASLRPWADRTGIRPR